MASVSLPVNDALQYYFEGADPTDLTKLDSDYIKRLSLESYQFQNNMVYVSPKVDGVRVILYHKIRYKQMGAKNIPVYDEDVCHMVTRRGEHHIVSQNFIPPALKATPFVFDVEIVHYHNPFVPDIYYIMDILHFKENDLHTVPFKYRLPKLEELEVSCDQVHFEQAMVNNQNYFFFRKVPYKVFNPTMRMKDITSLVDVETDGVVFCFAKDWVRQARKRFKIEDTIDFQIMALGSPARDKVGLGILVNRKRLQGPSRILNRSRNRGRQPFDQTVEVFSPLGIPQTIECENGELEINGIYEFRYNLEEGKFVSVRRRLDKRKPNKLYVANFIFNQIIKKKHLINPFQKDEEEEEEKQEEKED